MLISYHNCVTYYLHRLLQGGGAKAVKRSKSKTLDRMLMLVAGLTAARCNTSLPGEAMIW